MNKEEQLSKFDTYLQNAKDQGINNDFNGYLSKDDGCIIARLMVGKFGFDKAKEKIVLFNLTSMRILNNDDAMSNVDRLIAKELPEFPDGFIEKASSIHFNNFAEDSTIRAMLENWS